MAKGKTAGKEQEVENKVDKSPIDTELLIRDRYRGLTYQEIGSKYGMSPQNVHQRLAKSILANPELGRTYAENKEEILNTVGMAFLREATDEEKLKKTSSRDAMVSFGIAISKKLEESGKAPGQQPLVAIQQNLNNVSQEIAELQAKFPELKNMNIGDNTE